MVRIQFAEADDYSDDTAAPTVPLPAAVMDEASWIDVAAPRATKSRAWSTH